MSQAHNVASSENKPLSLAARDLVANPVMPPEFLQTLYGDKAGDAWVCAVDDATLALRGRRLP